MLKIPFFFADGMKKSAKKFSWEIYRIYLLDIFYLSYFLLGRLVVERVPETRVLSTCSAMEKWIKGKLNKAFLHFLPSVCYIWWFFKMEYTNSAAELWKIIRYGKNSAKMKKSLAQLALKPFFGWFHTPKNHISGMYLFGQAGITILISTS